MTAPSPTVSIGDSFLKSLFDLPDHIMKKAREAITKFRNDPTSPGLNYEKIQAAPDPRMRSIRIDQNYRAIVLKSEKGDAFILLWIDKHDEAYAWACTKRASVHPKSGAIQIVEVVDGVGTHEIADETPDTSASNEPDIFSAFSDSDLRQLGATDDHLPLVRSINSETRLMELKRRFPDQLYQGLYDLACGESFDAVIEGLGIETGKEYDPGDFRSALELDANKQHFALVTDDAELESILNEPLAFWRVFLHPSQRRLVTTNFNGPARVLGGAGTGKTVVAMHRAKHLASQCADGERILFTTFTKSLIHDIKLNLQKICTFDELKRIEVQHLDAWCVSFLRSKNLKHQIFYEQHPLRKKLWEQALELQPSGDFPADFLRSEWDKVIQYHDVESFADYASLPRPGRDSRLSRLQRKAIWPVFEEYRALLVENQAWEPADMFRAARSILESERQGAGFKHVIVDEIQDFHPQAFRLLRAMIPADQYSKNDLFLVGDGNQNIYGHRIVLGQLGIDIRGRGRKLKLNYRTPEETRRWAVAVLNGQEASDLDGGIDSARGYHSCLSGPDPVMKTCGSFSEVTGSIVEWYRQLRESNPGQVACVAVRTNSERDDLKQALGDQGVPIHCITGGTMDIDDPNPLRLATMHRIKGLEFDHVCLVDSAPTSISGYTPERQLVERCLLHVAATRTKNSLLVVSR